MKKKKRESTPIPLEKEIPLVEWAIQKHFPVECDGRAFPIVHRPWMQVIQ